MCINIGGDEQRSVFANKRLWLVGGSDRINALDANWEVSTIGIVTCYRTWRIFFFFPVEETYCTHYTGFFVGAGLTCCRWNKEDLADSAIVTEVLKLTVWAAYQLPRYVRISDLQSYIIQLPVCVDYMSGRNWISDGVKRISLRHCVHARSGPTCLVSSYYRVLFWRRQNGRVATLTSFSTYCTIFWTVSVATVLWTSWCGCELDT